MNRHEPINKIQVAFWAILVVFVMCSASWATTYYIDGTNGNDGNPGTFSDPFKTISKGLDIASAGDTIRLFPGTYYGVVTITKSGLPEQLITIISNSSDPDYYAIIDGQGTINDTTKYGIKLKNVSWIVLENLKFRNCFKDVIQAIDSNYISVKNCNTVGGRRFFNAKGSGTHHILIEDSYWEQDSRIWTDWDWKDCHDNVPPCSFNGSFFDAHSGDALGASVIRNNHIKNVFNGIQMWTDALNNMANIEIYKNTIEYVLDNAIEAERNSFNLHVYHNVFNQVASGVFSFTGVAGGNIYIYGNVGYYDSSDPATGGGPWPRPYRVYKMTSSGDPYFDDTVYLVHNSCVYKYWEKDSSKTNRHIRHYNNIGVYTNGYTLKNWEFRSWDNIFDYDFSNKPWPSSIEDGGQEHHGIVANDPRFINAATGDFRLQAGSPCIDKGKIISGFTQSYEGSAPDIGAYEGDRLVEGPPFYIITPPGGLGYNEKPRITRHRVSGSQLRLFFSWPLQPSTVTKQAINLTADGNPVTVDNVQMGSTYREVIINTQSNIANKRLQLLFNPLPVGDNGETATLWASTLGASTNSSVISAPSNFRVQ